MRSYLILPLLVLLLVAIGCSTSKKATDSKSVLPPRVCLTPAQQHQFNLLYHEALMRMEDGEYDAYVVLLERAIDIDSTAAEALWLLSRAQYDFARRNDSTQRQLALHNMKRAAYYAPNSVDIQKNLAIMFDREGRHEEALTYYERIAELHPTKGTLTQLAESYKNLSNYKKALEVYNKMERQSGRTKDVVWGKLGVLVEAHDSTGLFTFLDTVINERPNEYEYQIYKGDCYAEVYNRPDLAEDIYKGILEHSPANKEAQYALIRHYTRIQDLDKLFESVKRLVSNNHIEENIRTEILTNYIRYCVGEDSLRLNSVRSFLDNMDYGENATGEISATHVVLLSYMNAAPDSILQAINRTLKYHPEDTEIRRHGMYLCYRSENTAELLRLCEEGQYYDPKNLDYYHLPAIFYLYDENYDAAIKTLERGEPYYMENPDDSLASELYNLMGDIYHDMGRMEECYAAYDSALALIPDNALVLNNYAYFLSLDEINLNKALTMAHRANELSPNNATYLDTYAWVLYQLGQYTQAKIYIDQALAAVKEDEESSTYYKHAGDIYWKIGDRKNARKFWKKAEELEKE